MAINDNTSYELFGYQVKELATKINSKAEAASLAPVATSGLYSDITGAPTVPTVYNGKLTITQNGKTLGEFTANQSTDTTIDLENSSYSTSEVKTNATWIDGKPIYKKTIDCGALPNATGKGVDHGITNFGELVKIEGAATFPGYNWIPLPYPDQNNKGIVGIILNPTAVYIFTGENRSQYTQSYVTLWYTKTTD